MYSRIFLALALAIVLAACSHKSPEELMADGNKAEEAKDYAGAVNAYTELVRSNPNAPQAEEAQYRIALIYNNDMHDAAKAIDAYRTLYTKFPGGSHTQSALFLTGFLFNNELHNIDSARAVYQAFLNYFPNSELANSAQFELSTLGKDPESVLHNDILAKQSADSTGNGSEEITTQPARLKAPENMPAPKKTPKH